MARVKVSIGIFFYKYNYLCTSFDNNVPSFALLKNLKSVSFTHIFLIKRLRLRLHNKKRVHNKYNVYRKKVGHSKVQVIWADHLIFFTLRWVLPENVQWIKNISFLFDKVFFFCFIKILDEFCHHKGAFIYDVRFLGR